MSQCTSIYTSKKKSRGVYTSVFCTRDAEHEGDHRGERAQWNAKGERVAITLPQQMPT